MSTRATGQDPGRAAPKDFGRAPARISPDPNPWSPDDFRQSRCAKPAAEIAGKTR